MWTKERFLRTMADAPRSCALVLKSDADGIWLVAALTESGGEVPCRKARDEKTAVRRMAELYRKTADESDGVTIAQTDDFTAAYLAGQLGKDTTFEPLDRTLGSLALVYSGTLRSSPLV